MTKKKILVVTANPDTPHKDGNIRTDRFQKIIEQALSDAGASEKFDIKYLLASNQSEFFKKLELFNPNILHLIGHGEEALERFVFENNGEEELTNNENLTKLVFQYDCIECIIISACFSKDLGSELSKKINYVACFDGFLDIEIAKKYTENFYFYLGNDNDYQTCNNKTRNFLLNVKFSEDKIPNFVTTEKIIDDELSVKRKIEKPNNNLINKDCLFIAYTTEFEKFYLVREIDTLITKNIGNSNIWISGDSGLGKTNLILRNLMINKLNYIYCDLSPVEIKKTEDVFNDIIQTILNKYPSIKEEIDFKENNEIKLVSSLLVNLSQKLNQITIVIDEFGIVDKDFFTKFVDKIIKLSTYYTNLNQNKMCFNFIISTIHNPIKFCENRHKAKQYFTFHNLENWKNTELKNLFEIVNKAMKLNINEEKAIQVIEKSNGNPRLLKNIMRKISEYQGLFDDFIEKAVLEALDELI